MANQEHIALLKQDVNAWNAWRLPLTLGHALSRIIEEYPLAKGDAFQGYTLASMIRDAARREIEEAEPNDNGSGQP